MKTERVPQGHLFDSRRGHFFNGPLVNFLHSPTLWMQFKYPYGSNQCFYSPLGVNSTPKHVTDPRSLPWIDKTYRESMRILGSHTLKISVIKNVSRETILTFPTHSPVWPKALRQGEQSEKSRENWFPWHENERIRSRSDEVPAKLCNEPVLGVYMA